MSSPRSPRRAVPAAGLPAPRFLAPLLALLLVPLASLAEVPAAGQASLAGSRESMLRQSLVAQQHDYAYLRTSHEVLQEVASGVLVPVHASEDLQLADGEVSFPYARPEVKTFLEQLAHAYRAACGEPLVVTSLTRPISHQPWNASPISVHPTGMATDLRRSDRRACRQWIEATLLALEGEGMIEATRERWPAHYHVAVFPDPLLLPGPIGDPNGVIRLAALHHGPVAEPDFEDGAAARPGHVHLSRSARTGRFRITQTGHAVARRASAGRIVVRRSRHAHAAGATARHRTAAAVVKHRARGRSRSSAAARTATAR
jgi:Family of unknown function (DUF5715)